MPTRQLLTGVPPRMARTDDAVGRASSRGLTLGELWTVLAVGLPVLGSLIAPMSTVDLAYQVRAGQLTLATGSILTVDPFTFTVGGEPWLNQQWAAGLLFGAGYNAAGWAGLAIVRALLIASIFGLVFATCRASGADARSSSMLTIAAFGVSIASLALRAQLLGMLLFAATLAILAVRDRRHGLLWLLPFLYVAWANVHGSFVLGLAAIGAALLADLDARRPRVGTLAVVLALCAAATLLNPFAAGVWGYSLSLTASSQITRLISEWQPVSLRTWTGLAFAASALAMGALLAWRGRSLRWPVLAWLALLFVVGLYAERGVAWWALGSAPVAAAMLAGAATAPFERRRVLSGVVAIGLGVAILAALPTWRGGDPRQAHGGLLVDAPSGVTGALLELTTDDDRLFAAQRWASWFELAVPGVPVMVDSRIELYPDDVWTDYLAVSVGREDWREILDRWDVTVLALQMDQQRNLLDFVHGDSAWSLAYEDADGAVYVRAADG